MLNQNEANQYKDRREYAVIQAYRQLTELEKIAVCRWIHSNDSTFIKMFKNDRVIAFVSCVALIQDNDLFEALQQRLINRN